MAAPPEVCISAMYTYLKITRTKATRKRKIMLRRHFRRVERDLMARDRLVFVITIMNLVAANVLQTSRALWSTEKSDHWWQYIANRVFTESDWVRHFRMKRETFDFLCDQLRPHVEKANTHLRRSIGVQKRVAITLWRLATNVEYRTIAQLFGVGISTVCIIVHETCSAIVSILTPRLICLPKGEAVRHIIDGFEARWGFPQCCGAIDGTHLPVLPRGFKTDFYNRKGWYSVVLQGMIDHQYRFLNVNFGFPGSVHDARVFANSSLYQMGERGELFPPLMRNINGVEVPVVILADSAYPLLPWVMKPYMDTGALTREHKTFNYRLSRARMVTENAYGRLKGRWRILLKRNDTDLSNLPNLVLAVCTLHNLCETTGEEFDNHLLEGVGLAMPNGVHEIGRNNEVMGNAESIRDALKHHLCANQL